MCIGEYQYTDFYCYVSHKATKNKLKITCGVFDVCSLSHTTQSLFALVSVLSQSFFTLVSRHFMTLMLLTVWHS